MGSRLATLGSSKEARSADDDWGQEARRATTTAPLLLALARPID